jgi:hypothetical protein
MRNKFTKTERMVTLEKQLMDLLGPDAKQNTLTPLDVQLFFNKSQDKLKRLIAIKKLFIHATNMRLKALKKINGNTVIDSKNVVEGILSNLLGRLAIAKAEFEDRKQNKRDQLIKQLKIATMHKRTAHMIKCLIHIDALNRVIKDMRIADLQEQILKYSTMAKTKGKTYLSFYSREEECEKLLNEIVNAKLEVKVLTTILV